MSGLREKKKTARKDRIFSSALDLFVKKGFSNTSVQDIAEKSNLAVGTLYNYFPSKHDLLLDIMHEHMEFAITDLDKLFHVDPADHNAKDVIKSLLRKIFSIPLMVTKESIKELFIATFSSEAHLEKGMLIDIDLMKSFKKLLDRLQENNMISDDTNTSNATQVFYSILLTQMMMYIFDSTIDSESLFENTDELIDLIFHGIEP